MYLDKMFIRNHKAAYAIFIFVILFTTIHLIKPGFAYGDQGEFRQFGVGYRNKTVVPIWGVAIALAIFCYLFVYHLTMV